MSIKDNMNKKIKSAVSKRLREQKEEKFIFEGIDEYDVVTLDKFFENNDVEDYIWEEDLEEALYTEDDEIQGDQLKQYDVGDIIMTKRFKSRGKYVDSVHRILVITSKVESDGVISYKGFLLSSKIKKANKNGGFPNNIYIKSYQSILDKGAPRDKEAFIRVDDIVSFTNKDLDTAGSWKGRASREFMEFTQKCYNNYKNGIDNSQNYWE